MILLRGKASYLYSTVVTTWASIPFSSMWTWLNKLSHSMSQFEVVILNWIVRSVFQKGYTKPFIQHQSVVSLEHIAVIPDYGVLIIVLFLNGAQSFML